MQSGLKSSDRHLALTSCRLLIPCKYATTFRCLGCGLARARKGDVSNSKNIVLRLTVSALAPTISTSTMNRSRRSAAKLLTRDEARRLAVVKPSGAALRGGPSLLRH